MTDANLVLGYYDPSFFLGGRMSLDQDAATRALAEVGGKIGLDAVGTAWGVHRVVTESMAAAARIHIVEKGKDPARLRDGRLRRRRPSPCGGRRAHPGHAGSADPACIGRGVGLGFLAAPLSFEQVRSHPVRLDAPDAAARSARCWANLRRKRVR